MVSLKRQTNWFRIRETKFFIDNMTTVNERSTIEELHRFITDYPRLFVLTGAGCSTASGLGDYRDKNGQWKRPQPITGQTFINDTLARKRYWARSAVGWPSFHAAKPAAAHHALARLQQQGFATTLVTQNVDEKFSFPYSEPVRPALQGHHRYQRGYVGASWRVLKRL